MSVGLHDVLHLVEQKATDRLSQPVASRFHMAEHGRAVGPAAGRIDRPCRFVVSGRTRDGGRTTASGAALRSKPTQIEAYAETMV
jgi:hypothetical protein